MSSVIRGLVDTVYCAFCKLERKVYTKKHINWANVLLSLFASALLMFAFWQTFDPRAVIFFFLGLIVSEVFVHMRWRLSLPCPHCGFDPLLYKVDREKTVQKVKKTLEELRVSGRHLLSHNNPFLNLPKVAPDKTKTKKTNEPRTPIISKRV